MPKHLRASFLPWLSAAACLPLLACQTPSESGDELGDPSGITTIGDGDGEGESSDDESSDSEGNDSSDTTTDEGDGDTDEDDESTGPGTKFDLGSLPDGAGEGFCAVPKHTPCDDDNDPWHAMGINCPGEYALTAQYTGDPQALYVHTGQLGTYNPPTYPVQEGGKMVILSSGKASDLTVPGLFASTSLPGNDPIQLPAPIKTNLVGAQTCTDNPALIGTGDCSNTINAQWMQGSGAYDYGELRLSGEVPMGASGFAYNLAFFSTEYPGFYKTSYNDMYIAWLESELWTGNVSFDELGNPISLNAGFLDYKDAPNPYDCPNPCQAPELQGTAMQGHAGTKWLTTTAGVVPGEQFTLLFSIFDLSDNVLDSMVILDNFTWNCEGGPPITIPG